jgi:hypothetical protein
VVCRGDVEVIGAESRQAVVGDGVVLDGAQRLE